MSKYYPGVIGAESDAPGGGLVLSAILNTFPDGTQVVDKVLTHDESPSVYPISANLIPVNTGIQAVDKPTPKNKQRVDLVFANQHNLMM